ncbi:hypothetical protein [Micromonospora aurantiaca (nom. illeg.)]|uniref:hypothetical protein n=2 Tax=Micromonospora TaxID=1873 RepID=UPI000828A54F|nr:hypothetical protein [Micromonospora aurantiaca]SCL35811.1 hypothetical protein GA0070615_2892 [Micromonospora aurantiaca]
MIPEPMPEKMPISMLSYVIRHLMCLGFRGSEFQVLSEVAYRDRDNGGSTLVADVDLDRLVSRHTSRRSLDRALKRLLDAGDRLRLDGDRHVIVGAVEHDTLACEHRHCASEVAVARRADE